MIEKEEHRIGVFLLFGGSEERSVLKKVLLAILTLHMYTYNHNQFSFPKTIDDINQRTRREVTFRTYDY